MKKCLLLTMHMFLSLSAIPVTSMQLPVPSVELLQEQSPEFLLGVMSDIDNAFCNINDLTDYLTPEQLQHINNFLAMPDVQDYVEELSGVAANLFVSQGQSLESVVNSLLTYNYSKEDVVKVLIEKTIEDYPGQPDMDERVAVIGQLLGMSLWQAVKDKLSVAL